MLDLIVIGYGPGSQQLIVRLKERMAVLGKNLSYIVIEKNTLPGSSFYKFPVHKKLISNNKLYTGKPAKSKFSERFDWNSIITEEKNILGRNYSQDFYPDSSTIYEMMRDIHEEYEINVNFKEDCKEVIKEEEIFNVITDKGEYESRAVVVATGYKPHIPNNIQGIELAVPYEKMKHSSYYRDKKVFIIGKGNSGLECAKDIMNEANMILLGSPSSMKFAYQSHYVGNARIVNSVSIENYQLKSMSAILDCKIQKLESDEMGKINVFVKYMHANDEDEVICVDEVICATGFKPNMPNIKPEIGRMSGAFPEIEGNFCSKQIKNLYFAGALTHGLDYKQHSSSGFIHGFRYNSLALADILLEDVFNTDASEKVTDGDLKEYIFDILNNDPGIYLQPGFLGACLRIKDREVFNCSYKTVEFFKSSKLNCDTELLLTLEYGNIDDFSNILSIPRVPGSPEASAHIHPIIRVKDEDGIKNIELEENLFNDFKAAMNNQQIVQDICEEIKNKGLIKEEASV